jgi:prophage antirepressor-like protein
VLLADKGCPLPCAALSRVKLEGAARVGRKGTMQLTQFVSEAEGFAIRAVESDGSEWFIAKDVCDALGIKNSRDALKKLDEDERHDVGLTDAIGRSQPTSSVNESGLYALILRSNKPKARAFRKWVTSEVLPAIRKTGGYSVGGDPVEIVRQEVERLTRAIIKVGVPEHQAEKAAQAAFRAKLSAMRAALAGRPSPIANGRPRSNGSFSTQYSEEAILRLLSEPMMGSRLCERVMGETGMSRSTFWRILAQLRSQGKVRDRVDSAKMERVWEEGGVQCAA